MDWVDFEVMLPKLRIVPRGAGLLKRLLFAIANYLTFFLQIFFVRADICWVANCPDIFAIPLAMRNTKYILEYRSPWSVEVKTEFGKGPLAGLASIIENAALKNAFAVTLTTGKLSKFVNSFDKPTFVIPNYPTKNFKAQMTADEFRKENNVETNEKIVLFVGKLSRVEGADMFPSIIEDVLKEVDCVFWIVGDGPLMPMLKRFEKKFEKRVRLFGWQPHDSIPNFINAADVCIVPRHPSKHSDFYNEESLFKLGEYMAFRKPIVACGIAESTQYLLVTENKMADATIQALRGKTPVSTPKSWEEDSEKILFKLFNWLKSSLRK
jgi:glycosyltransferase involved in cell wall biosynthesis